MKNPFKFSSSGSVLCIVAVVLAAMVVISPAANAQVVKKGQIFPDFAATDPISGKKFTIEDFRGKVVLIDFWATWCPPCIAELPNVKKVYNKYHDQGFEIISISLDTDKRKFGNFVKSRKMSWNHVMQGGGWNTPLAKRFGIRSIPAMFLLDTEGVCISTSARGKKLESAVKSALANVDKESLSNERETRPERIKETKPVTPRLNTAVVMELRGMLQNASDKLAEAGGSLRTADSRTNTLIQTIALLDEQLPAPADERKARDDYVNLVKQLTELRHDLFMYGLLNDVTVKLPANTFVGAGRTTREAYSRAKLQLKTAIEAVQTMNEAAGNYAGSLYGMESKIDSVRRSLDSGRGFETELRKTCENISKEVVEITEAYRDPWKAQLKNADEVLAEIAQPLTDAIGTVDGIDVIVEECRKVIADIDPTSQEQLKSLRENMGSVCEAAKYASANFKELNIIETLNEEVPANPYDTRRLKDRRAIAESGRALDTCESIATELRASLQSVNDELIEFQKRVQEMQKKLEGSKSNNSNLISLKSEFDKFCDELLAFRDRFS